MPDLTHTIAYRAVHGAVRNVLYGHPNWNVPPAFARSVAKRAAGTLTALQPSLLAAARQSGQRRRLTMARASGGIVLTSAARFQLESVHAYLNGQIAAAHKDGDHERYADLITAARIIKREIERHA